MDQINQVNVRELHARFAAIIESSDDAIISQTLDGIITSWSLAAERLFGYTAAEIINQPITRLFPPTRLEESSQILERLKRGERIKNLVTIHVRKDGKPVDVSTTIFPVKDDGGKIIGAEKIVRDISERKRMEEMQARFAAIIESSYDTIISKTLDGIITSWNPAAERLFGYTAETIIGQPITRLFPPERLDEEPKILERLKNGERVEHFETVRLTKHGRRIEVSVTISPIKDPAGWTRVMPTRRGVPPLS